MKHMTKTINLILLLCLGQSAIGQINLHRSYFFNRSNVKKLANNLTRNAESDSQKVANIHFWVTHHIKYDAKRYVRWQTKNQDTKDVLRRRKTLCTGYSNLFKDLCFHSAVPSVVVDGYTKNILVDVCDTTYLPDHSWNQVKFNDQWHNMDNTWDAGYVKFYKTGFIRQFMSRITFRWIKPYKYKPHFVKAPMNYYFALASNKFTVNHLPQNPFLQDFESVFHTELYAKDSAHYFYRPELTATRDTKNNLFLNTYVHLDRLEQQKNDGKNAAIINSKNRFGKAHYYSLILDDQWFNFNENKEVNQKDSMILKDLLRTCDSVKTHTTANDSLLWEEYKDLMAKRRDKGHIQRKYSSDYSRYLKRKDRFLMRTHSRIRSKKRIGKRRTEAISEKYSRIRIRHYLSSPKWPKRPKEARATLEALRFKQYTDSMEVMRSNLYEIRKMFTDTVLQLANAANQQSNYIGTVAGHFYGLWMFRMDGLDDYDYPIQLRKQDFFYYAKADSNINLDAKFKAVYNLIDSMYKLGKSNYKLLKRQHSTLRKIKRSTRRKSWYRTLDNEFMQNLRRSKKSESSGIAFCKMQLKQLKKINKFSAPTYYAKMYANAEKRTVLPSSIIQNKRRKHARDNRLVVRSANRIANRCHSKLDRLRYP